MKWEPTDEAMEAAQRPYAEHEVEHRVRASNAAHAALVVDAPKIAREAAQAERDYIAAKLLEEDFRIMAQWVKSLAPRSEAS